MLMCDKELIVQLMTRVTWPIRQVVARSVQHSIVVYIYASLICFLGDDFSIIGATIIVIGFYTVMWGKAKEELGDFVIETMDMEDQNHPLLQSYKIKNSNK